VDSENGSQGLFRNRSPSDLPPDIVEFDGRTYTLLRPDFWDQQVLKAPLYTRGWVLQGTLASLHDEINADNCRTNVDTTNPPLHT
jgi:hypothetical protein